MPKIVVAVCVAVSAIAGASASAQPPADEQQPPTAAEVERLRSELEQAREALEAAARDLASRAVPAPGTAVSLLPLGDASRWASRLGASLVDAEGGALVTAIVPGGGASDAGIEVGDVIQSIDGLDLSAEDSPSARILERLAEIEVGDSVTLAVERAGEVLENDVEIAEGYRSITAAPQLANPILLLDDRPSRIANERAEGPGRPGGALAVGRNPGIKLFSLPRLRSLELAASAWGEMELVPMTSGLARYFGTEEGLLVIRAPSDASIGIEEGDVILAIGGRTPNSPEHAIRILASFEPGETIEFSIMRERIRETVTYAVQ